MVDCDMFRSNLLWEHHISVTQLLQQEYSSVENLEAIFLRNNFLVTLQITQDDPSLIMQ